MVDFPALDQMTQNFIKWADEKGQQLTDAAGELIGNFVNGFLAKLGKGGISLGGGGLADAGHSLPKVASVTPSPTPVKHESLERSHVPEKVKHMARESVGSHGHGKGYEVASMSGHDFGNLAPTPISVGGVQQSQGYARA